MKTTLYGMQLLDDLLLAAREQLVQHQPVFFLQILSSTPHFMRIESHKESTESIPTQYS